MHPLVIGDGLEEEGHIIFKSFVDRLVVTACLYAIDGLVDCTHDEIVVFASVAVLEGKVGLLEKVMGRTICIIYLADGVVQVSIDLLREGHRVLLQHVL